MLTSCRPELSSATPLVSRSDLVRDEQSTPLATPTASTADQDNTVDATPSPTPTPDPFSTLYGCSMALQFVSGPLESKNTQFDVLGLDYFQDKGDKFKPGKGTGIYYEDQHYFIIHSSFVNGNVLRPMEAEFIRKYLEYWGSSGSKYVQGQIDSLIDSEVLWVCNGELTFRTRIDSITRLSHEATNDIWLNPQNLEEIIARRDGIEEEWIGQMEPTDDPHLYLGFCGWGPDEDAPDRYTYFRYLFRFEIL
jgi:hypothetical protein